MIAGCELHLVQWGDMEETLAWKKKAEEWENKVKWNEEDLKKLESKKKKLESEKKEREREQYEGELGVVLWNSVSTMLADFDTDTRLGQCLSPRYYACSSTMCASL